MGSYSEWSVRSALKRIVAPTSEPITLAQAKEHLRKTTNDEDTKIAALIPAAREVAESYTGRRLITQTWEYCLDCFPCYAFELPHAPLQSVTSVKYIDASGIEQTMSVSDYVVQVSGEGDIVSPGRISPAYGASWPSSREQLGAVTVRFVCGYGDVAKVPSSIWAAMLLVIGELFERREETVPGLLQSLPRGVEALLGPYRILRI